MKSKSVLHIVVLKTDLEEKCFVHSTQQRARNRIASILQAREDEAEDLDLEVASIPDMIEAFVNTDPGFRRLMYFTVHAIDAAKRYRFDV